ncbi:MAG: phosphatase PAP2 family protein, partial [Candidatus Diapherotrites archaeon]|nr:phosphatase PAP2 family protein [Candidatus Diapherotrites archaeon]
VGISRMYLGVHFLTDVIIGIALGGGLGYLSYRLFVEKKHEFFGWRIQKQESLVLFLLIATVVLAANVSLQITYSGGVLAGYFAGLLIRPRKLIQKPLRSDLALYRSLGGAFGFGIISLIALSLIPTVRALGVLGSLLAGLWITFLYPFILKNVAFDDIFKR